jgi:hypothetical protein
MQHDTAVSSVYCLPVNTALRLKMLEPANRQLPATPLSCPCDATALRIHSRDGLRSSDA